MEVPFTTFSSKVVPLTSENIDTDQIIPARYLKGTDKAGLAEGLFRDWRFAEDGSLKEPRFVLDRPEMAGRQVLLVGGNFGVGSSREHAPWALLACGFRVVLSTSFADIFKDNSLKNGLLPIVLDAATHQRLIDLVVNDPDATLVVNLSEQGIGLPDGSTIHFNVDAFAKAMLLAGTDEMGYLLSKMPQIEVHDGAHPARVNTLTAAD